MSTPGYRIVRATLAFYAVVTIEAPSNLTDDEVADRYADGFTDEMAREWGQEGATEDGTVEYLGTAVHVETVEG